jgi:hypothetical protein
MTLPRQVFVSFRCASAVLLLLALAGCGRFRPQPAQEFVYVSAKGTFLRDRVAAVTNRVAEVANGQRLQVLEHGRRFLKVKTDKNEIGWIEDHAVIDQKVYDVFSGLRSEHAHDPVIATAVLRDDSYLHDEPGRKTDHFYLLPENDKLQLLVRASVPKPVPPQAPVAAPQAPASAKKPVPGHAAGAGAAGTAPNKQAPPAEAAAPPALEDYWLIRDQQGVVGWVRARSLDVDVPDAIAGLAEGQRIIGAYVLKTVDDPDSSFPNGKAPEYIAAFSPYRDGLPYDFDQVRIFTWNVKKHRYETAYRQRNMEGFLPVTVSTDPANAQVPVFSWRTAPEGATVIDPQTGIVKPGQTTVVSFRLEGVVVRNAAAAIPKPAVKPEIKPKTGSAAPAQRHRAGERKKKRAHHPARN